MAIKTDIAEHSTQRVATILANHNLTAADKRQQIQDEFERAMERWQKIVLAHGSKKRKER